VNRQAEVRLAHLIGGDITHRFPVRESRPDARRLSVPRMELRAETMIDAQADAVWAVLGASFGRIDVWAAPISLSAMDGEACVGAVRTCHFKRLRPVQAGHREGTADGV
jgi:hypothetical protein